MKTIRETRLLFLYFMLSSLPLLVPKALSPTLINAEDSIGFYSTQEGLSVTDPTPTRVCYLFSNSSLLDIRRGKQRQKPCDFSFLSATLEDSALKLPNQPLFLLVLYQRAREEVV